MNDLELVMSRYDEVIFWVKENVLFYEPIRGVVKPQGVLIGRAIREVIRDVL